MPGVAVLEPNPHGHRLEFCNLLLSHLVSLGFAPTLFTSRESINSDQFKCFISPILSSIKVSPTICNDNGSYWSRAKYFSSINRVLKDKHLDFLFIPDAALITYLTSSLRHLFKPRNSQAWIEGLILGGQFGYFPEAKTARSRLTEFLLSKNCLDHLFHLDPYQERYLRREVKNISLMPDPVGGYSSFDMKTARNLLRLPADDYLIGSCGTIEFSKGHDLLISSFARSIPRLPSNSRLVFAGKIASDFLAYLRNDFASLIYSGKIILIDKFLSIEEIDAAIHSLDLNVVPYRKSYQSSGILLRCLHSRRNLLATNKGWIGRTLDFVNFGLRFDIHNPQEFDSMLQTTYNASVHDEGRLTSLLRFHSPENYQATWTRNLCEKACLSPILPSYPYPIPET